MLLYLKAIPEGMAFYEKLKRMIWHFPIKGKVIPGKAWTGHQGLVSSLCEYSVGVNPEQKKIE